MFFWLGLALFYKKKLNRDFFSNQVKHCFKYTLGHTTFYRKKIVKKKIITEGQPTEFKKKK